MYLVGTWDDTLNKCREEAMEKVNNLFTYLPEENFKISVDKALVQEVTDCHLRPDKKAKKKIKCQLCHTNDYLKEYEFKLFAMQKRTETFEEMSLKGSWKPTSEELILKGK